MTIHDQSLASGGNVSATDHDAAEGGAAEGAQSAAVERQRKPLFSIGHTIKPPVIMSFSRQLSSFLEAGIPLLDALEIVEQQAESPQMRAVVADIGSSIHRGTGFAEAVDAHADVFPSYYRAMLKSAEYTGDLDQVLNQLATYMERDIAARRQVKSALTYPILVLVIAVAAMIVMSVFVLPKFSGLYRGLGARLPLPTRMLMGFTDFMATSWPMIIVAILLVVGGLGVVIGGDRGKRRRDALAMKLPLIGNLYSLISLERFCRVSVVAVAGRRAAARSDRTVGGQHEQLDLPVADGQRARDPGARRRVVRADGRDRALPDRRPPDDPSR